PHTHKGGNCSDASSRRGKVASACDLAGLVKQTLRRRLAHIFMNERSELLHDSAGKVNKA
ncbi:MAG: hypothetical protein K2O97_10845, partial [Acetatifactor sp.]|nr:hypothetical protein [Acetatifactor sp.]